MYYYIAPFLVYLLTIPFIKYGNFLVIRTVALLLLLLAFRKHYKFKLRLEVFSVLIGIVIFLLWVLLEGYYPMFGSISHTPKNNIDLLLKILSFVVIAPIVEEFFVRNLLARILLSSKWKKIPLGKFTITSFIFTVAFFGFSHNRWLPGLFAGALLNYLIYKKRDMGSVVMAHFIANVLLTAYIIYTKSWSFW